jgi:transcription initiation factor TFIIB
MNLGDIDNLEDIEDLNDDDLFTLLDDIVYDDNEIDAESDEHGKCDDKKIYCEYCKSDDNIIEDFTLGIIVCKNCGSVITNIMDNNPEWRQYNEDGKAGNGRCSVVTSHFLPQSSLGTNISGMGRSKIKILHSWSKMPYKERSLNIVLKEIQAKCESANILKCIEHDGKILYKNISECKHIGGDNNGKYIIIRGKNRKSLIAACVFFACKRKGHTRSPKEIASIFGLKYTEITKGCKTFLKLMKIKKMSYEYNTSMPEHFIPRFCKELNINKNYIAHTFQIVKNIQKLNIASEHTPISIATGAILLVVELNNLPITRKMIATAFEVSEVTITKAYRKLYEYKKYILNTELTNLLANKMEEKKKGVIMPKELVEKFNKMGFDTQKYIIKDDCVEDIVYEKLNLDNDTNEEDLNDYINSINLDVYEIIAGTESEYNEIINDIYVTI